VAGVTISPPATRSRSAVWRRQFLLQGCWNYEGMQNVGFAYAILPALRDFYANRPEDALKAVKRHLEFFNTHPAMGALVLGASVRLEERVAAGETDPRAIGTFKVGLMGSLGAVGDSFFWGALRPMASVAGALLALLHPLLGVAALILLYNGVHLTLRRRGFAAGMQGPEAVVAWLKQAALNVRTDDLRLLAAILAGAYAGVFAARFFVQEGGALPVLASLLLAAAAVHLFSVLFRKAVSPSEILSFLLLVGVLILWR